MKLEAKCLCMLYPSMQVSGLVHTLDWDVCPNTFILVKIPEVDWSFRFKRASDVTSSRQRTGVECLQGTRG